MAVLEVASEFDSECNFLASIDSVLLLFKFDSNTVTLSLIASDSSPIGCSKSVLKLSQ